ncbi:MAG: sugar transferase [Candidatus Taylorbacteria bacterium]|nr:sugar transferase [Candidatus Taylorbacteria bacterium]
MHIHQITGRKDRYILSIGDLVVLMISLFITLFARYGLEQSYYFLSLHIIPFSVVFVMSLAVFFIVGLYEREMVVSIKNFASKLVNAQIINGVLAVGLFYFFPEYGIAPKVTLTLYILISLVIIFMWRLLYTHLFMTTGNLKALLIAHGDEASDLWRVVMDVNQYSFRFVQHIDPEGKEPVQLAQTIEGFVKDHNISFIVLDERHPVVAKTLPYLYGFIFQRISFIDIREMYESVFERAPLSLLSHEWFLQNITNFSRTSYDFLKRLMDIFLSAVLAIPTLICLPVVWLAIKLSGDKGPLFIIQSRIGQGGQIIKIPKFRTMTKNDNGIWPKEGDNHVTKVGRILRKTRIDELPQIIAVLRGDMSLIGPRPDIIDLGHAIAKELPFYAIRNMIKPGLSGWAQIKQENPPHSLEETRERFSYDLYYVKNRSLILDAVIALKTIKTLLSRTGK